VNKVVYTTNNTNGNTKL